MATNSGMDYAQMVELVSFLQAKQTAIVNGLTELSSSTTAKVASCYEGAASSAFQSNFAKEIERVSTTLDDMIKSVSAKAEEKQAAYVAQDARMESSVAGN